MSSRGTNLPRPRTISYRDGSRSVLEVNHVPNVTVFPEVREAYLDLVVRWAGEPPSA